MSWLALLRRLLRSRSYAAPTAMELVAAHARVACFRQQLRRAVVVDLVQEVGGDFADDVADLRRVALPLCLPKVRPMTSARTSATR